MKEIIHRYKEGWGINDEADAYLIRKLLNIDIIIYKDIQEAKKLYHAHTPRSTCVMVPTYLFLDLHSWQLKQRFIVRLSNTN